MWEPQAALPSERLGPFCTRVPVGDPITTRITSVPLRPRCFSDQESVCPGVVATSWKSLLGELALSSANCRPAAAVTPLKPLLQSSIWFRLSVVDHPGTSGADVSDTEAFGSTGASKPPLTSATVP